MKTSHAYCSALDPSCDGTLTHEVIVIVFDQLGLDLECFLAALIFCTHTMYRCAEKNILSVFSCARAVWAWALEVSISRFSGQKARVGKSFLQTKHALVRALLNNYWRLQEELSHERGHDLLLFLKDASNHLKKFVRARDWPVKTLSHMSLSTWNSRDERL